MANAHGFFNGKLIPDSYIVVSLRDRAPLHLLVELDRGTETLEHLRAKAKLYDRELRYRAWRQVDPIVLFVVPSQRRANTVTGTLAETSLSLAVIVWSGASTDPPLANVLEVDARRRRTRSTAHAEGVVIAAGI